MGAVHRVSRDRTYWLVGVGALLAPLLINQAGARAESAYLGRYGLSLQVVIPHRTYPVDALVRVRVELRNVGSRPVHAHMLCPSGEVGAEVLNDDGQSVYPPALEQGPEPRCRAPTSSVLSPGVTLTRHLYIILRGDRVRAYANIEVRGGASVASGPVVRVRLIKADQPQLTVQSEPQVQALVVPGPGWHGHMHVVLGTRCPAAGANGVLETVTLTDHWIGAGKVTSGGTILRPECPHPTQWDAVAGWVGHSVVTIHLVNATSNQVTRVSAMTPPAIVVHRMNWWSRAA